jgi:mRNA interferase MazF
LKRGDIVVVALQGDLGKPRPAVIVETDLLAPGQFVLVCPGTSHVEPSATKRRLLVTPDTSNGLREPTQFQVDRLIAPRRQKCGMVIGRLDEQAMAQLDRLLMAILGLAD